MAYTLKQQERDNRISFLNLQESEVNSLIAQLTLSANRISAVPLQLRGASESALISSILDSIENERLPLYDGLRRSATSLINLGATQTISYVNRVTDIDASVYLTRVNEILAEYLDTSFDGGKRLSDLIWSDDDKVSIIRDLRESVANNETPGQLADRINRTIKTGTPRYTIDRIANTELVRAYSRGRARTMRFIEEDFGDEVAIYVKVLTSPMHPKPDICDALVGTYRLGQAPIPPHHPNCICLYQEEIRPANKKIKTTTVQKSLVANADLLSKYKIDPVKATSTIELA